MNDPDELVLLDVPHHKPQHTPRVSPYRRSPPLLARQMGLACPDRVRSLSHPVSIHHTREAGPRKARAG
ncbi:hypothetical protein [Streptomyces pristinaespiralis]|uniref:hypothetical protein n=1 Tax=Streptomyces pristinaespiralis TaxID=38300 RepID=UPI00340E9978